MTPEQIAGTTKFQRAVARLASLADYVADDIDSDSAIEEAEELLSALGVTAELAAMLEAKAKEYCIESEQDSMEKFCAGMEYRNAVA